jgi:hypothetical protein
MGMILEKILKFDLFYEFDGNNRHVHRLRSIKCLIILPKKIKCLIINYNHMFQQQKILCTHRIHNDCVCCS